MFDIEIISLSGILFVFKIMEEGAHQFKSVANQSVVIDLVFPSSQLSQVSSEARPTPS